MLNYQRVPEKGYSNGNSTGGWMTKPILQSVYHGCGSRPFPQQAAWFPLALASVGITFLVLRYLIQHTAHMRQLSNIVKTVGLHLSPQLGSVPGAENLCGSKL